MCRAPRGNEFCTPLRLTCKPHRLESMWSPQRVWLAGLLVAAGILVGGSGIVRGQPLSTTLSGGFEPIGGIGLSATQPVSGSFLLPGNGGLIFRLHHTAGEQFGSRPGFTSFGMHRLTPLAGGVWLLDGQLFLDNEGEAGGSFDSMWRWTTTGETVWGIGLGADITPTSIQHTAQGVVSLEMLRRSWGIRANAYAPFDTNATIQSVFSSPFGLQGTQIVQFATEQQLIERAMSGIDVEFHRRLGVSGELFAGGYAFQNDDAEAAGWKAGLRGDLTDNISAHLQVTHDDLFETRVSGGLTWFFGPGRGVRTAGDRRLTSLVNRNHYVSIDRSGSLSAVASQVLTDQATGDPLHLFFAAEGGTGGGTEGNPTDIATVLADPNFAAGSVLVLVDSGGALTTPIALTADRQQVLGASSGSLLVDLAAATGNPDVQLSFAGLGGRPTLAPTLGPAAIQLSNSGVGHVIAGFTLDGSGGGVDGIRDFDGTPLAPGGTDTLIRDMLIQNFTGTGVFIQPSVNTTIENTIFSGNGTDISLNATGTTLRNILSSGALGDSISLANTAGTTHIENVAVTNSGGAALSLNAAGGEVNVNQFQTTNAGAAGIQVLGGTADINFVGETTISGSGTAAVAVQGGTAELSFDDLMISGSGTHGVLLAGFEGLFTVTRTLSVSGAGGVAAIGVENAGATAVANFGETTIIASGTGTRGIDLNANHAASQLAFENLRVTTLDGIGFSAVNGGLVDFLGTPAEIDARGGAAIDLTSTRGRHDGTAGWRFTSLSSTDSAAAGVRLDSLLDDLQVVGTTSIENASGNGFELSATSGDLLLTTLSIDGAATGLQLIDHTGTFTVTGIDTVAGTGGGIENVDLAARLENATAVNLWNMELRGATQGLLGVLDGAADSEINVHNSTIVGDGDAGIRFETTGGSTGTLTTNLWNNEIAGQSAAIAASAAGGDIVLSAEDNNFAAPTAVAVAVEETGGANVSQARTGNTLNDQSWLRSEDPLLVAGSLGSDGKRENLIADPDVVYDPLTGTWHLYYATNRSSSYTDDSDREYYIQHATSTDGTDWVLDSGQALSLPLTSGAWDAIRVETPSVLIDPTAPADRRFKLYYSGANDFTSGGFPNYQLGLAFSSDGSNFSRLSAAESPYAESGAVLRVGEVLGHLAGFDSGVLADPEIQLIDGTYNLWFSSFAQNASGGVLAFGISRATSADGINWTADNNSPVPSLLWPDTGVGGQQPSVTYNPALDRWETYFTSDAANELTSMPSTFNPSLGAWRAVADDYQNWTIDSSQRAFGWNPAGSYEELGLLTGLEVVVVDDVRHVFYTGWSPIDPPPGFVVPTQSGNLPAVLTLLHATQSAFEH